MTEITELTARLLAHRWLPRADSQVRRALVDESFRAELEARLAAVGLQLLDNPFAEHVAVGLRDEVMDAVFGGRDYQASTMGLTRDEIALLVVIWALIILPKRERQLGRRVLGDDGQDDMFGQDKPIEHGEAVSGAIAEASLLADFGAQLGGKTKVRNFALGKLARLGFIERRNGYIHEGPLLDVLLDYRVLADRIINGTLADVLAAAGRALPAGLGEEEEELFDETDEAEEDFGPHS
ncbi:MAG: hypothetical protein CGU28_05850 [Candidatus Dactylopiibacterium carminicum]|uniref:DUF4194 domain-containing protein n=1 Tax=Candidatus Dactylopiibacterium carminicum TaxID=857335 RepID=A0A272EV84_9RHOO|nr:hypothetical protein [Candidatus Dactylopiibacterium carminicum]KAF7599855.1 hypothetical protein BGI27_05900 [Candidatus Dactylopiibacterium carminicum]PAS93966.1 MAG: hypothetical protein CGU29_05905 [Candidatus Dactylopiibacterium carminicum]PAS97281.1 MAG: hypothetical protein CGU28_05850 [Candidatus Dactylopiibacterium carminicum]PAS99856.1 MAG: hypothetical protein BSR46_05930 [Candidatus Dactylopiibacterium carminicum]